MKKYIEDNYPSIGKVLSVKSFGKKRINGQNFLVCSEKGKFVLKHYTDGSCFEKMKKLCLVLKALKENNIKAPEPIKNIHGTYVDKEQKLFLTEYIPGRMFLGSKEELEQAGKSLANLHFALSKLPFEYAFSTNQKYFDTITQEEFERIKGIVSSKKQKGFLDKKVLKNSKFLEDRIADFWSRKPEFASSGLIHHDFQPGNIVFKNNELQAILDFNSMRKGSQAGELAFACFRFACSKTSNIDKIIKNMGIFFSAYNQIKPLSNEEKLNFISLLKGEILAKTGYIIKKKYLSETPVLNIALDKKIDPFLKYLSLVQKVDNYKNKEFLLS